MSNITFWVKYKKNTKPTVGTPVYIERNKVYNSITQEYLGKVCFPFLYKIKNLLTKLGKNNEK